MTDLTPYLREKFLLHVKFLHIQPCLKHAEVPSELRVPKDFLAIYNLLDTAVVRVA